MFLSAMSPGFSVVLEPRGRLGGLGGKVGTACEEFKSMKALYWVNVSESSVPARPGCHGDKGPLNVWLLLCCITSQASCMTVSSYNE